jgi:hypothetical protein
MRWSRQLRAKELDMSIERWIATASLALAMLAVIALPASANVPPGRGLVSFGEAQCEGLGTVEIFGPRGVGPGAEGTASAWASSGEHLILESITITITDSDGHVTEFSKTYGTKKGLATITCTQHLVEPDGVTIDVTVIAATVPPD